MENIKYMRELINGLSIIIPEKNWIGDIKNKYYITRQELQSLLMRANEMNNTEMYKQIYVKLNKYYLMLLEINYSKFPCKSAVVWSCYTRNNTIIYNTCGNVLAEINAVVNCMALVLCKLALEIDDIQLFIKYLNSFLTKVLKFPLKNDKNLLYCIPQLVMTPVFDYIFDIHLSYNIASLLEAYVHIYLSMEVFNNYSKSQLYSAALSYLYRFNVSFNKSCCTYLFINFNLMFFLIFYYFVHRHHKIITRSV